MAKQRLLLVDADPGSLKLLGASLRNAGFTVSAASALPEALTLVESVAPDLVISDTKLGDRDGFELVQQLKGNPDFAAIPFIFLSSDPSVESKITGLELGVDDYLTKPIFLREIIARVKVVLARREREGLEGRSSRTQFSGSLEDMGTVDLVQTIDISRKTGVLELRSNGQRGGIWFLDGSIVDAEIGALRGERAFYRLLLWTEGRFELHLKAVQREATIRSPSQALLMEGMRRIDEWGRLLEQIPPLDHVLDVDDTQLRERLAEIPDEINGVLRAIDGRRSLRAALDEIAGDDLETLSTIAKLFFEGLVLDTGKREPPRRPSGSYNAPGPLDLTSTDVDGVLGVTTPNEVVAAPSDAADPVDDAALTHETLPAVSETHGRDEPTRAGLGLDGENSADYGSGTSGAHEIAPPSRALDGDNTPAGEVSRGPANGTTEGSSAGVVSSPFEGELGISRTKDDGSLEEPIDESGKERRMTRKIGQKRGTRRDSLSHSLSRDSFPPESLPPEPTNVIQFPSKGQSGRGTLPAGLKQTLSGLGPDESSAVLPGSAEATTAAAAALQIEPPVHAPARHDEPSQSVARREPVETRSSGVQPSPPEPTAVVAQPVVSVGAPAVVSAAATAPAAKAEPMEPAAAPTPSEPPPPPQPSETVDPLGGRPSIKTLVVTPAMPSPKAVETPHGPAAATVTPAALAGATAEMQAPATTPPQPQPAARPSSKDDRKGKQGKDAKKSGDDWKTKSSDRSNPPMPAATAMDASARSSPGRSNPRMERVSDPHEATFFTASGEQGHAIVDDFSDLQAEKGGPAHPGKWVTLGIVAVALVAFGVFGYWKLVMDPGERSLDGKLDEGAALAAASKAVGRPPRQQPARPTTPPRAATPPANPPAPPAPAATTPETPPAAPTEPATAATTPAAPAEPVAAATPAGTPTEPTTPPAAPSEPVAAATPPAAPATPPTAATPAAPATTTPAAPAAAGATTYEAVLAEGDGHARRGRSREAIAAYERAITINPAGDAALSALAFIHLNRGRNREAAALAERAVAANQQNAQGWIVLGAARDALGNSRGARDAYRSCVTHGTGRWVRECRQML